MVLYGNDWKKKSDPKSSEVICTELAISKIKKIKKIASESIGHLLKII